MSATVIVTTEDWLRAQIAWLDAHIARARELESSLTTPELRAYHRGVAEAFISVRDLLALNLQEIER
jgi:hypothetical protein